jgi:hypothetical protein
MYVPYKLAVLLHKLREDGGGPIRQQGGEFRCHCPAHDDGGPSLYLGLTEDRILIRCNAGCTPEEVCNRLDHAVADLFFDGDEPWIDADGAAGALDGAEDPHGAADGDHDGAAVGQVAAVQPGCTALTATAQATDEMLRHAVYAGLLGQLELSTAHFENLRKRGLIADEIAKRGYRTADSARLRKAVDQLLQEHGAERLMTVPGFAEKDGRVFFAASNGMLIPTRDLTSNILALKVRHDSGYNGPKYTWASSRNASSGNMVHVPLGVAVQSETARLTEGELKADVATALSKLPTISAPGVGSWHLAVPVLRSLGATKVLLAMDQDGKPGTLAAIEKALFGLTRAGFTAELEWWDGKAAKGIDDLLAVGGRPEVITGIAAVVRVRGVLEEPGPEAQDAEEPEPAPFPVDVLPPALATYVGEVAEATATPPDFAAVTLLVTAGAALGNSRALCLKENVWYEGPRFYAANVGDTSSGKTPAMDEVLRHYQALQSRLLQDYKDVKADYDQAKAEYEQVLKENRALPPEQRLPLPTVPDEPEKPERFITIDATVESLGPLLEGNPRGLLMPWDEGVAWVRGMGQYKGGRGNDRQFWLSNWSGKMHMVDRKGQGVVPIIIPRPFVNVICGMPPDMLGELADCQGRNDGFLHRILFAFPRCAGASDWEEVTVDLASKQAWEQTLVNLRKLVMQELDDGDLGYKLVKFSPAAKEAWVAWWNAHAAEIRSPDLPLQLTGPWGKLRSYAARLALLLHYLWLVQTDQDEGDVEAVSVERAATLIDYYKSHLRRVYARLRQTPEDNHLLELIDWVRQQGGQCTVRQAVRAKKVASSEKAKKLFKELEERGYGRIELREGGNGRKVPWFVFDPT